MAIITSPKLGTTLSMLFIVIYLFLQFTRPFFFSFETIEGKIFKYEYVPNKKHKDSKLLIWLNDTIKRPYKLSYKYEQEKINSKLDSLSMVKIWIGHQREIQELTSNGEKIINYQWFVWLYTFFLIIGLFYHLGIYRIIRKDSVNINSYSEFWQYYFGERPLIMKRTNKPYDPNDSIL